MELNSASQVDEGSDWKSGQCIEYAERGWVCNGTHSHTYIYISTYIFIKCGCVLASVEPLCQSVSDTISSRDVCSTTEKTLRQQPKLLIINWVLLCFFTLFLLISPVRFTCFRCTNKANFIDIGYILLSSKSSNWVLKRKPRRKD